MSWRSTQLNQELCDQDRVILDLFDGKDVHYVGYDQEFKSLLNHSAESKNLILIFNRPVWCSDIVAQCHRYLTPLIETFYIGVNRYCIKGNDTVKMFATTGNHGQDIVNMLNTIVSDVGCSVVKSGHYDQDLGRHFNFVQPLTWIYGAKTNQGR